VLSCAGPFKYTAEPLVEGCLRSRAHYLDITGEIPVYEAIQARTYKRRIWCEAWVWRIFGGKLVRDEPGQAC